MAQSLKTLWLASMIALSTEAQSSIPPVVQGVQQSAHFALLQATENLPKEIQEQQKTGVDIAIKWIQSKQAEYDKSANKIGFILGLLYGLCSISVWYAYYPQFRKMYTHNNPVSTATFAQFWFTNTVWFTYAVSTHNIPLILTMAPATFWCWLIVVINELKTRRWDYEHTIATLLDKLATQFDPKNPEHMQILREKIPGIFESHQSNITIPGNEKNPTVKIPNLSWVHSWSAEATIDTDPYKLAETMHGIMTSSYSVLFQTETSGRDVRESIMESFNRVSTPIGIYNIDGSALYLNDSFVSITGYTRKELMDAGPKIVDLLYKNTDEYKDNTDVKGALASLPIEWGYVLREFWLTRKDGKRIRITWNSALIKNNERPQWTIRFGVVIHPEDKAWLDTHPCPKT